MATAARSLQQTKRVYLTSKVTIMVTGTARSQSQSQSQSQPQSRSRSRSRSQSHSQSHSQSQSQSQSQSRFRSRSRSNSVYIPGMNIYIYIYIYIYMQYSTACYVMFIMNITCFYVILVKHQAVGHVSSLFKVVFFFFMEACASFRAPQDIYLFSFWS